MKVVRFLYILLFLAGVSLASNGEKLYDKIEVIVNDEPVLKSEIDLAQKWFNEKDRKKVVEKIVDQILIAQEARKKGIRVYPEEVKKAVLKLALANKMTSVEEFKEFLKKQDIAYNEFTDLIRREILVGKYVQFILKPKALKNLKEAKEEKLREVYVLFLSKKRKDFDKVYKKIKEKLSPDTFEELAKKYSDDPITKDKGGYLGKIKKGELLKALDEKVWSMKVGEIAEVDTKAGVFFVYVKSEEKKMVPQEIPQEKLMKKLDELLKLEIKKLRQKAIIKYLD